MSEMNEEELQHNESVKIVRAFCKILGVYPEELEHGLPAPITEEKAHDMAAFVRSYAEEKCREARIDEMQRLEELENEFW